MKQKKRQKEVFVPNIEQCVGCFHWRRITGLDLPGACHCILDTGHCRERDGDKCLSKSTKMERTETPIW